MTSKLINDFKRTWRDKAHKLIGNSCAQSYVRENFRKGKKLKKHHPYQVPSFAEDLIEALDKDDEEYAKALFLSYEGLQLTRTGE